jgi:uncharacterized protein YndB with AHSA1/START domain
MRLRSSYAVRAPIDKVYAYLSDPRRFASLERGFQVGIALGSEQESGAGARFRIAVDEPAEAQGTWITELISVDPPHGLTARASHVGHDEVGTVMYRLESTADGTVVHTDVQMAQAWSKQLALRVAAITGLYKRNNAQINLRRASNIEEWECCGSLLIPAVLVIGLVGAAIGTLVRRLRQTPAANPAG